MELNFYDRYKLYSTVELLLIINQPKKYQKKAVETAKHILAERHISEEEKEKALNSLNVITTREKIAKSNTRQIQKKWGNVLRMIVTPSEELNIEKWLNLSLVLLVVQFLHQAFKLVQDIFDFKSCYNCNYSFLNLIPHLSLIYIPIVFYLLFKGKRWGWILLFADIFIALTMSSISQVLLYSRYRYCKELTSFSFLFTLTLRICLLFFLIKKDVTSFFSISFKTIKNTIILCVILVLVVFLLTVLFLE